MALARWVAGDRWMLFIGLQISRTALIWFGLTFVLASALIFLVLHLNAELKPGLSFHWQTTWPLILLTVLIQSFCEEVLFRTYLTRDFLMKITARPGAVPAIAGCVFSGAHWLNYRAGEGVHLSASPLFTLFLLGCCGTLLFVRQGNILGAWGFHAGWNFVRFSFEVKENAKLVAESKTFELIEGSRAGLAVAALLLLATFFQPMAKASR
jgi:membrane protease YdiL (CAAX protease family)